MIGRKAAGYHRSGAKHDQFFVKLIPEQSEKLYAGGTDLECGTDRVWNYFVFPFEKKSGLDKIGVIGAMPRENRFKILNRLFLASATL